MEMHRRSLLAAVGSVGVGGCLGLGSGDEDGDEPSSTRQLLDRTFTPSNGNPVVETLDAGSGAVLEVNSTHEEEAALAVVHGDSGLPVAASGLGVVYEQARTVRTDPLPESSTANALCLSMHERDRADVTITVVEEGSPAAVTRGLTDEIAAIGETVRPGAAGRRAAAFAGPAWLWLFEAVRTEVVDGGADAGGALDRAVERVYGALARHEAETWVGSSVRAVAEALGSGAAGAVQSATGLPAFLVEGALQDRIAGALQGEVVSWRYSDPDPGPLALSGGEVTLVATLTAELRIEGVGFTLDAPLELLVGVDGDTVPASATVEEYEVLTEAIDVTPA